MCSLLYSLGLRNVRPRQAKDEEEHDVDEIFEFMDNKAQKGNNHVRW